VIYESWFWKRELIDLIGQLEAWSPKQAESWEEDHWSGEANFRLERSIFFSALAVRRLVESHKISDSLLKRNITFTTFPASIKGPTKITHFKGADDLLAEYDFGKPEPQSFLPHRLVSEVVHSMTLEFYINDTEDTVEGFFLSSEFNNYKRLIDVPSRKWLDFLNTVIVDNVDRLEISWSKGDKKIEVIKEKD